MEPRTQRRLAAAAISVAVFFILISSSEWHSPSSSSSSSSMRTSLSSSSSSRGVTSLFSSLFSSRARVGGGEEEAAETTMLEGEASSAAASSAAASGAASAPAPSAAEASSSTSGGAGALSSSSAAAVSSAAGGGAKKGGKSSKNELATNIVLQPIHEDTEWQLSQSRLTVAIVFFILALVLPPAIYFAFYILESNREREVHESEESAKEGEERLVDQRYALARDSRELLSIPIGTVAFVQFLGLGLDSLNLPTWWGDIPLNETCTNITAGALILAGLWTWFRGVDVAEMAIGRQAWVVRSKMFSLYDEAATKIAYVVKFLGALLVVIVIIIMWGTADDFSSQSAMASLSVATLGSLAFIGNMFRGTLRQYKAGLDLIEENRFRTGDEIEIYGRTWGRVRGKVAYIESRFSIIIGADGKKMYVPTEYIPSSCIINHSRSTPPINVYVNLNLSTPPPLLEQLRGEIREAVATHPAAVAESVNVSLDAFTPTSIVMKVSVRSAPGTEQLVMHEDVMLVCIQVSQRVGVTLATPSATPDVVPKSFSTT